MHDDSTAQSARKEHAHWDGHRKRSGSMAVSRRDPRYHRLTPDFWDHQRHVARALLRAVRHLINQFHAEIRDRSIVDLGCGDCPYEILFRQAGCESYIRCDMSGNVDVVVEPGQQLDLPANLADVVVSFQVLEHVWDLDWYLGEARRLLRPGGVLLLSTHGNWLYHPHPTDYRRWTQDGLVQELTSRGYQIEQIEALVGPLAWTTQFRLLGIREVLKKIPLIGPAFLIPIASLMNVRMILEDAITPSRIRQDNACIYAVVARKPYSG